TLGVVLSGVGGNLLASELQTWVDLRNEAASERDFAQTLADALAERAENDPQWRDALDEIHQKLDSLALVPESATADAQTWFVRTLRHEARQLGNQDRYEDALVRIENSGAGAVATHGGVAASERSVVAGSVHSSTIFTGDNPQITINQAPAANDQQPAANRQQLLTTYLHALRTECDALPLAAMGGDATGGREACLQDVYIELDTTAQIELPAAEKEAAKEQGQRVDDDAKRPLKAREAAERHPYLLLLGDPGSGKSTFVRQLTVRCADGLLHGQARPLPIFVVLHELIEALDALARSPDFQQARQRDRRKQLLALFQTEWTRRLDEWGAAEFADELVGRAKTGKEGEVLLVLDGLDEIPERLRPLLIEAIQALGNAYAGITQVIVTCRSRSYWEGMLPGYTATTLAVFTNEQIANFVTAWYRTQQRLGRMDQRRADQNIVNLQSAAHTNLRELASNPMLLTTMTIIHQRETRLPDQRVELYNLAVDVLMKRWQQGKDQINNLPPQLDALLADSRRLRLILEQLAYAAHRTQAASGRKAAHDNEETEKGRQQPLRRGDLLVLLESQLENDTQLANEFLDYIDHRAGLLVGRGGVAEQGHAAGATNLKPQTYSFPHRTFQEYLAGCHMNLGRDYIRTYLRHVNEGDYWRVAALLGAEELFYNNRNPNAVLDLAYALCPVSEPETKEDWRSVVWSAQMATLLGRKTIAADDKPDGGQTYLDRLLKRLVQLPHTSYLTMTERAEAGQALGQLGDPRPGVGVQNDLPAIDWISIAAGPFMMGTDPQKDKNGYDWEQPQFTCNLISKPYSISRYPITVAQYDAF
ncbi:MAG: NACHT domain-containing protein, partial [Caldilineaceae bacterium]|nr:NACHT domain-containing protein [Caldilineaceae bacterium]